MNQNDAIRPSPVAGVSRTRGTVCIAASRTVRHRQRKLSPKEADKAEPAVINADRSSDDDRSTRPSSDTGDKSGTLTKGNVLITQGTTEIHADKAGS